MTTDSLDIEIITPNGAPLSLDGKTTVMALGTFDGVHSAHTGLITETVALASRIGADLCGAWCFSESPAAYFKNQRIPLLCTLEDRIALMLSCGLDFVAVGRIEELHTVSAEDFVDEILKSRFGCIGTVCGFNHRFGHKGKGSPQLLKEKFGNGAVSYPEVKLAGETVSSTAIREHLAIGDIKTANLMLGRNFYINTKVLSGKRLGRTIGFPTVNQTFPDNTVIPHHGIYATLCTAEDGRQYIGVSNVGVRPTITDGSDSHAVNCETYLIDFEGDLYGQTLKVEFCSYLREEKKFSSIEELSSAIENDRACAIRYFGSKNL